MTTSYRRRQKLKRRCVTPEQFRSEVARIVRQQQGQPVRLSDLLAAKSP